MRIKLPCKKDQWVTNLCLVLGLLMVLLSSNLLAEEDRAVFWAVEKDDEAVGYLLGTIHSEDPRVLEFSEGFLSRLRSNTMFAMEMVPDLSTLARLTEYMHYPAGKTLDSVIGAEQFDSLVAALSAYKVPEDFIARMKPWAAMMTLSTPPPKTGFFMDLSLSLRASGNGLRVVGLETLEQQLSFLEDMPLSMQLKLLNQAIAASNQVMKAHDQMLDAYLENNLVRLQAMSEDEFESIGVDERAYFFQHGIQARNHRMLESLLPHYQNNSVFVAVGALHLPGEDGLLNLLRQNGFTLKPLDMPFVKN